MNNFLNELKKAKRLTIAQKIQLAELEIEAEALEIEKAKSRTEQKFWSKSFAATMTAIISLAAVLISFAQVWSSNIQKEKELALKDKELEIIQIKNQQHLNVHNTQLTEQQKSEVLKFISGYKDVILDGDTIKINAVENFIRANYPIVNTEEFFSAFEITTISKTEQEIKTTRTLVIPKKEEPYTNLVYYYGSIDETR